MLELWQVSTLNQTVHGFVAYSTYNYGYGASFRCCHLTAISQCNYHSSAKNDSQLVLFNQLCSNKAVAGATINQSYKIHLLGLLTPSVTE